MVLRLRGCSRGEGGAGLATPKSHDSKIHQVHHAPKQSKTAYYCRRQPFLPRNEWRAMLPLACAIHPRLFRTLGNIAPMSRYLRDEGDAQDRDLIAPHAAGSRGRRTFTWFLWCCVCFLSFILDVVTSLTAIREVRSTGDLTHATAREDRLQKASRHGDATDQWLDGKDWNQGPHNWCRYI